MCCDVLRVWWSEASVVDVVECGGVWWSVASLTSVTSMAFCKHGECGKQICMKSGSSHLSTPLSPKSKITRRPSSIIPMITPVASACLFMRRVWEGRLRREEAGRGVEEGGYTRHWSGSELGVRR